MAWSKVKRTRVVCAAFGENPIFLFGGGAPPRPDADMHASLVTYWRHVRGLDLNDSHLPRIAKGLDARITQFEPEDESLESVFRYLVRRR